MLYCARISLGEKQVSALQIRTGRKDNIISTIIIAKKIFFLFTAMFPI